jgi:hypothetical protein
VLPKQTGQSGFYLRDLIDDSDDPIAKRMKEDPLFRQKLADEQKAFERKRMEFYRSAKTMRDDIERVAEREKKEAEARRPRASEPREWKRALD